MRLVLRLLACLVVYDQSQVEVALQSGRLWVNVEKSIDDGAIDHELDWPTKSALNRPRTLYSCLQEIVSGVDGLHNFLTW